MANSEPPRTERRMATGITAIGIVAATIAGTAVVTHRNVATNAAAVAETAAETETMIAPVPVAPPPVDAPDLTLQQRAAFVAAAAAGGRDHDHDRGHVQHDVGGQPPEPPPSTPPVPPPSSPPFSSPAPDATFDPTPPPSPMPGTVMLTFVFSRNRKLPMPADTVMCAPMVAGTLIAAPDVIAAANVATCECSVTVPRAMFLSPGGIGARVQGRSSAWTWSGTLRVTGLEPATGVAQ